MLDLGVYIKVEREDLGYYLVEYYDPEIGEWIEMAQFDQKGFKEAMDCAQESANDLQWNCRLVFVKTINTVWKSFVPVPC